LSSDGRARSGSTSPAQQRQFTCRIAIL
jgi:hypothetical protein